MSDSDFAQLVEKIVTRVMQRIQADDQLAALVKSKDIDKTKWARTCSTYRHEDDKSESPKPMKPVVPVNDKPPAPSKKLYTERDIVELAKAGHKELVISKGTILTPSAKDAAAGKGIVLKQHH